MLPLSFSSDIYNLEQFLPGRIFLYNRLTLLAFYSISRNCAHRVPIVKYAIFPADFAFKLKFDLKKVKKLYSITVVIPMDSLCKENLCSSFIRQKAKKMRT